MNSSNFDLDTYLRKLTQAERVKFLRNNPDFRKELTAIDHQSPSSTTTKAQPKPNNAPNKTEREALHVLRLHLMDYEGRTFDNPGGGKYTPDWYGNGFAVEVKGEYIHDRGSRPKFDAAKAAHPELAWIWARKRTKGRLGPRWEIQIFPATVPTTGAPNGKNPTL